LGALIALKLSATSKRTFSLLLNRGAVVPVTSMYTLLSTILADIKTLRSLSLIAGVRVEKFAKYIEGNDDSFEEEYFLILTSVGSPYIPYFPACEKILCLKKDDGSISEEDTPFGHSDTCTNADSGLDKSLDSTPAVFKIGHGALNETKIGEVPSGANISDVTIPLLPTNGVERADSRNTTPVFGFVLPKPPTPPSNAFDSFMFDTRVVVAMMVDVMNSDRVLVGAGKNALFPLPVIKENDGEMKFNMQIR